MPADDILQLFTILVILILVMAAAYVVTRYIAGLQTGSRSGNNIEVIETYRLSPSIYTQILRVGKTYVAVAISKDNVTLLAQLSEEEITFSQQATAEGSSFKDILGRFKQTGPG